MTHRLIRPIIVVLNILLAAAIYIYIVASIPASTAQTIKLTQLYGLIGLGYLYITLLISPLYSIFDALPYKSIVIQSRRALGVSAFLFAILHVYFAFFKQLGGFNGLGYLSNNYLIAISLGFVTLLILAVMTATSTDFIIKKLNFRRWKMLHRLIYIAGVLVCIHASLLGSHISNFSGVISKMFIVAISFLLILEALRLDQFLTQKFPSLPRFGVGFITAITIIVFIFTMILNKDGQGFSFNIHSSHLQTAKGLQTNGMENMDMMNMPSMQGDRTKRYTVSFDSPEDINANTATPLNFRVYNAASVERTILFNKLYEQFAHLVIVDSELIHYQHIHPKYEAKGFSISSQFPHEGTYHLYLDFQPTGAIEQQFGFTITVGAETKPSKSQAKPEKNLRKQFNDYEVHLQLPEKLIANELSNGQQKLRFTIYNADTKKPVTNLKPYLGAYGHLVMIHAETFEYTHVHPAVLTPPAPYASGGPKVEFIPMSLYTRIKPGVYRLFAQFNPDNTLFTSDFTVQVE